MMTSRPSLAVPYGFMPGPRHHSGHCVKTHCLSSTHDNCPGAAHGTIQDILLHANALVPPTLPSRPTSVYQITAVQNQIRYSDNRKTRRPGNVSFGMPDATHIS